MGRRTDNNLPFTSRAVFGRGKQEWRADRMATVSLLDIKSATTK
jgi:hypothetical protein